MSKVIVSPNLDDLLLGVATAIELSDRDRRVVDTRYRNLKKHLERPGSPLAPYLVNSDSRIYPQGSIAAGTTVVSGRKNDRFDLDALVELNVPPNWPPSKVLDLLEEALQGFPDAIKIVRCTRCIQLQFAFMHMDVTVMDPQKGLRVERAGEIFHSPDKGPEHRVPANPYGFSQWFRESVKPDPDHSQFAAALQKRRSINGMDRISLGMLVEAAEQDDLPAILPPRLDSEQVVSLKLLKRHLNLQYEDRSVRRPPPIYLSKLTVDVGASPYGLYSQLMALAEYVRSEMRRHLNAGTGPDERNPSYNPDRLNDRWPANRNDMEILEKDMEHFISELNRAKTADFSEIVKIFSDLFGEKVSQRSVDVLLEKAAQVGSGEDGGNYVRGAGLFVPDKAILAPAIVKSVSSVPRHNFHCEAVKRKK